MNLYYNPPIFADRLTENVELYDENEAIKQARKFASQYADQKVYIFFQRSNDGQTGYLNPEGYGFNPANWNKEEF